MSAVRVRAVTVRILAQLRRDRRTLVLLFVAPLVILGLLDALLRGGGPPPAVGVVTLDQGPLGGTIARRLEASSTVSARATGLAAAERHLEDGSLAGYIVFPESFSERAAALDVLSPEVHLEGSQPGPDGQVLQALTQAMVEAAAGRASPGGASPGLSPRVSYRYGGPALDTLDYLGGAFIGLVVFFLVFVVTCVSFLRERSQGTLERLMASPIRRSEIVVGNMLGFSAVALVQSAEVMLFCLYVLKVYNVGNVLLIFAVEILLAVSAVNLGIFLSMFARTEFQAVQFIPLVIAPQLLLSGILLPVADEPGWLQGLSNVLPLTYAVYGLRDVMIKGAGPTSGPLLLDTAVVLAFCVVAMVMGALTLRRRVA